MHAISTKNKLKPDGNRQYIAYLLQGDIYSAVYAPTSIELKIWHRHKHFYVADLKVIMCYSELVK